MLLLVTTGHPDMSRYQHPNLGRLVQPRHYSSIEQTAREGIPWAADNDCFQGLDAVEFVDMLDRIEGLPGCLFVVVPDVVGDWVATTSLWQKWRGWVTQPAAYVLQDGCPEFPDDAQAVFVGGTTEWKMSPEAARLVAEAKSRGLWAHMGRVNSARRIMYAQSIGCDSVDGTTWAKWKRRWLWGGLQLVSQPRQMALGG